MHFLLALISLAGLWQGTLNAPGIGKRPREMTITKNASGYSVSIHSVTETDVPIVTHNVTIHGSTIVMTFDENTDPWMDYHRIYTAQLSADGKTISGTWADVDPKGPKAPMVFQRTTHFSINHHFEKADTYLTVENSVKDEVIDWGGTGRSVLLLAGAGVTARGFGEIVPDLIKKYHVYSMTRRGFGNSSKPPYVAANYNANRLGEDVLAVMNALHLQKPVLIGHSLAGEEMSYIAKHAPEKVSALVYLDAGYWYAFDLGVPSPTPDPTAPPGAPGAALMNALLADPQQFKPPFNVPILAFYAHPHRQYPGQPKDEAFEDYDAKQIAALRQQPNVKVVVIPNADHFVYVSNKDEVLRDINAFIATLQQAKGDSGR